MLQLDLFTDFAAIDSAYLGRRLDAISRLFRIYAKKRAVFAADGDFVVALAYQPAPVYQRLHRHYLRLFAFRFGA